jgi:hypothetical protein
MKESVVGSGPILMPGKSCSSRYLGKRKIRKEHLVLSQARGQKSAWGSPICALRNVTPNIRIKVSILLFD